MMDKSVLFFLIASYFFQELKSQLTKLEQEHLKWRKRSAQQVAELNEDNLSQEQAQKHMTDVTRNKSDQIKILSDALVYKLEGMYCLLSVSVEIYCKFSLLKNRKCSICKSLVE